MKPRVFITFFLSSLLLITWGCESLKFSRPVIPIREYERMIIGRLDANYVGTANCLKACHYHDKIRRDFDGSTMGAQLSEKSGLPLVDCESCHGPGSLAIEGITEERVQKDSAAGVQTACNYETFLDFATLEYQQGGDAADFKLLGDSRIVIDVDFSDFNLARV